MRLSQISRLLLLVVSPLALFVAGCSGGGKKASAKGNVTLNGQPLGVGMLRFVNPGTNPKLKGDVTVEIEDGAFTAKDLPVGDVKVVIETESLKGRLKELEGTKMALAKSKQMKEDMEKRGGTFKEKGAPDSSIIDEQIASKTEELKKLENISKKLKAIPKQYTSEATTPITVNLKPGENTLETIELTSK